MLSAITLTATIILHQFKINNRDRRSISRCVQHNLNDFLLLFPYGFLDGVVICSGRGVIVVDESKIRAQYDKSLQKLKRLFRGTRKLFNDWIEHAMMLHALSAIDNQIIGFQNGLNMAGDTSSHLPKE